MSRARRPRAPGTIGAVLLLALAALSSCATLPPPAPPGAGAPPSSAPAGAAPAPAPAVAPPVLRDAEPHLEVGLAWELDTLVLACTGDATWEGGGRLALGSRDSLLVRLCPGGFEALRLHGGGHAFRLGAADTAWLTTGSPERLIRWSGRRWRGDAKVFLSPKGKLTLALRLPLELYLLGVIPGEIGSLAESLIEAGRAQALAARSYTLYYKGRRASEGFDLYGTVEDQVYGAIESERPLATHCVESTRGQVALASGRPIRANYCSTCGGITAEVWEAWPQPAESYLQSHLDRPQEGGEDYCRSSSHYRWREEWPVEELVENVRRYGPTFGVSIPAGWPGALTDVRVAGRSRSGRVRSLALSGTAGEVTVRYEVMRQVLRRAGNSAAILRSDLFKIAVRRDAVDGRVVSVVATGAGNGHGVGLCQTGALGMARAGKSAAEIVGHYYSGVEIRRLYP